MSEKDREPGSDAPSQASEKDAAKPASEPDPKAPGAPAGTGDSAQPSTTAPAPPPEAASAPADAPVGADTPADAEAAAAAAKAEERAKVIAAARAKAEAAKAAKAAAAAAGGDAAAPPAGDAAPASAGDAPAAGGESAGDDAAKAEARAKVVAAAKAKAEAAKAAKAAAGGGAEAGAAGAKPAAKPKHEPAGDQPPWNVDPTAPEWKDEAEDDLVKALHAKHPGGITSARSFAGDLALVVTREALVAVASSLKLDHGYRYYVDAAGVDFPNRPERFEIVHHVYNHSNDRRVRLKIAVADGAEVPSLSSVWRGASWPEREAYDMYGIRFSNHPDHTRILLWEGFNGFPLRKDFPVEGIDTGSAIYPEYYEEGQGPISGTGTGWKPKAEGEGGDKGKGEKKTEEAS